MLYNSSFGPTQFIRCQLSNIHENDVVLELIAELAEIEANGNISDKKMEEKAIVVSNTIAVTRTTPNTEEKYTETHL